MRGVSYLALVEYQGENYHRFFSSKRARTDSPKAIAEAEAWASATLREHGTTGVRCSISKVLWSISG
jgi:hypothetical protein